MLFVLKDKDRHNKPLLQGFFAKRFGFVLIRQGLRSMPTHKPEVPANEGKSRKTEVPANEDAPPTSKNAF